MSGTSRRTRTPSSRAGGETLSLANVYLDVGWIEDAIEEINAAGELAPVERKAELEALIVELKGQEQ